MAKHTNLTSLFTAIADAIRAKKGTTDAIVADDFPDEIAGIEGDTSIGNYDVIWRADMIPYDYSNLFVEFSATDHARICGKYPELLIVVNSDLSKYVTATGAIQFMYVAFDSTGNILHQNCVCVDKNDDTRYVTVSSDTFDFVAAPYSTVFKITSKESYPYPNNTCFSGTKYNYVLLFSKDK